MPDPNCPKCEGTGFRIVERDGLTGAFPCDCGEAQRGEQLLDKARIPPNYARASLDSFALPQDNPVAHRSLATALLQAKAFARDFPSANPPGLLFIGEPGAGKTHLAIGVMKQLLEKGHECLFFDYQNLLDRIRSGYNAASGASDREAYRAALDAPVLVLDDLGAHRVTEWVEDTVTSIITDRCNHRKTLIATSNLPDPDVTGAMIEYTGAGGSPVHRKTLAEMIGARARSRLFEMCRVIKTPPVEDYRVKRGR